MRAVSLALFICGLSVAARAADQESVFNAIEGLFAEYLTAFNAGDANEVGAFWTTDAVSIDSETGQRSEGREAITAEFASFFDESQGAKLVGEVREARELRPGFVLAEGTVTLFVPDAEPVVSDFTAVLLKDGDEWLIANSEERDRPSPLTPRDALADLAWLIGEWRDDSEQANVSTKFRWSTNESFLIRSFRADYGDGSVVEGTQVIGWDALSKRIRTWTFDSDGSFGEGTVSKDGEDWLLRMSHTSAEGVASSYTQLVTRVDEDTFRVQKFGQTVEGVPVATNEPVTVVRVTTASPVASQAGDPR